MTAPRRYGAWLADFHDVLTPGLRVIDLGCGEGNDAREMCELGLRVVAMDRSLEIVRKARKRAPGVMFVVADLTNPLPFRPESADIITGSLSLHYFDCRVTNRIIADIGSTLKPGGTLLCRVNVVGDVASLYGQGVEHEPDFFEVEPGVFKRFFTPSSLHDTLGAHLRVIRIVPRETLVEGRSVKQTLVARATRTD